MMKGKNDSQPKPKESTQSQEEAVITALNEILSKNNISIAFISFISTSGEPVATVRGEFYKAAKLICLASEKVKDQIKNELFMDQNHS